MSEYALISGAYATVTPAGAFHAATGATDDPGQNLLNALLNMTQTPLMVESELQRLCPQENAAGALELLFRVQEIGWVCGKSESRKAPDLNMERDVPQLLGRLSGEGRALLADAQGFHLANEGFAHEVAEELSVLAADVVTIQQRHRPLVRNNLRINATGWAAVDAAGFGQLGFWPLQISMQTFVLVVAGEPSFNQESFTDLIWWLARRYS